ncbi:HSP20-like chaperone, partial [Rhizodiscina lignyota]
PRFNVFEGADAYTLEGELPGVDQKNISIEFTDENTLTVRGRVEEHNQSAASTEERAVEEAAQYHENDASTTTADNASVKSHQPTPWLSERFVGEFSRSFSFASRVNQEAVTASLQNGVLSIVVPKAAKPENRKITIE